MLSNRSAMFQAFPSLPADTVTTRKLQLARRSAERKGKPRSASNNASKVFRPSSHKRCCSDKLQSCSDPQLQRTAQRHIMQIASSPSKAEQGMLLLHEFALSQGWMLPALCRTWSFGLNCEHLLVLLRQLPPSMLRCFGHINSAWENILKYHGSESLKQKFGFSLNSDDAFASGLDRNSTLGKLTMTFDASSQMRTAFITNHSMSYLLNMNHDVLNCSLASYELPLPFCEVDFVCVFLHQSLRELTIPGVWHVKHLRLVPRGATREQSQLVSWYTFSAVDGDGRVVEVRDRPISRPCNYCRPHKYTDELSVSYARPKLTANLPA